MENEQEIQKTKKIAEMQKELNAKLIKLETKNDA